MKKQRFTFLVAVLLLVAGMTMQAQSKTLLRLNPEKGATYAMKVDMVNKMDQQMMGQQVKMDQHIVMVTGMKVLDRLPNGNILMEYGYNSFKMDIDAMGKTVSYDTERSDNDPAFGSLGDILKAKLKLEVTPLGKTVKVEGIEQYAQLMSNPQTAQVFASLANEEAFKSNFDNTFNYFPEAAVGKGDSWTVHAKMPALMNTTIDVVYKVLDLSKSQADLEVKADINMDTPIEQQGMTMNLKMAGNQSGTMAVNPEDGMLVSSDLAMKFNMEMKMKNPQSGEDMTIPMVMDATVKIVMEKK